MNGLPARRPSWQWFLLGTCVVIPAFIAIAGWQVYRHHRYKHFAIHEPGNVYRSAWVDADVFAELVEKHHVKTVVNLCFPGEMGDRNIEQRRAVEAAGAKLIEIQFPSNATWDVNYPSVAEMERVLDDPNNYPLWIHCQHGRERTVKALAMYDIRKRNMSAKSSLARMPRFDIDHPWPIVVFAYNYESQTQQSQLSEANSDGTLQADDRSGAVPSDRLLR